jgi:hypothetical protein
LVSYGSANFSPFENEGAATPRDNAPNDLIAILLLILLFFILENYYATTLAW